MTPAYCCKPYQSLTVSVSTLKFAHIEEDLVNKLYSIAAKHERYYFPINSSAKGFKVNEYIGFGPISGIQSRQYILMRSIKVFFAMLLPQAYT